MARRDLCQVTIAHRTGRCEIGEVSVVIAVSAAARSLADRPPDKLRCGPSGRVGSGPAGMQVLTPSVLVALILRTSQSRITLRAHDSRRTGDELPRGG
jgi:MoaE protein